MISDLDSRAREIFRQIVDLYLTSGEPVGSRTIAKRIEQAGLGALSPASVRSVMADLEAAGLLYAPHVSAGRLPTESGLRLFVDGLLELGALGQEERSEIDARCQTAGKSLTEAMGEATSLLSGLSTCAGLVVAPKLDRPLKHIEFVPLSPGRALVVLVTDDGQVENRVIDLPLGVLPATLISASSFLAARLIGKTLAEARAQIEAEVSARQHELDDLTRRVISTGLGVWSEAGSGQLIVKGQAQLLNNVAALDDLERIRGLFAALETYESASRLLDQTKSADGVKVFIGAESALFKETGCTLIIAPLTGPQHKVVGAIGVIGPTRLNYARIVPLVDYTAKVLGKVVGG